MHSFIIFRISFEVVPLTRRCEHKYLFFSCGQVDVIPASYFPSARCTFHVISSYSLSGFYFLLGYKKMPDFVKSLTLLRISSIIRCFSFQELPNVINLLMWPQNAAALVLPLITLFMKFSFLFTKNQLFFTNTDPI